MKSETGPYFDRNHDRLEHLRDVESEWATALKKCAEHVKHRIARRTLFGAHSEHRLGEEGVQFYVAATYEAILSGHWEWKNDHTLSEQMILIADSTISKEVEKVGTVKAASMPRIASYDDLTTRLYEQDLPAEEPGGMDQLILEYRIKRIETAISGDDDLELFWEGVKDSMKAGEIALSMNKTAQQIYKLRDRFIEKIRKAILE
jgi:hypothetical protein